MQRLSIDVMFEYWTQSNVTRRDAWVLKSIERDCLTIDLVIAIDALKLLEYWNRSNAIAWQLISRSKLLDYRTRLLEHWYSAWLLISRSQLKLVFDWKLLEYWHGMIVWSKIAWVSKAAAKKIVWLLKSIERDATLCLSIDAIDQSTLWNCLTIDLVITIEIAWLLISRSKKLVQTLLEYWQRQLMYEYS